MNKPPNREIKIGITILFLLVAAALVWRVTRSADDTVDPAVQERAAQIESQLQEAAPDEAQAAPAADEPEIPAVPAGRRPVAPR